MSEQSKALQLADRWKCKGSAYSFTANYDLANAMADELRRLDAENAGLLARLERRMADIGEFAKRYTALEASYREIAADRAALKPAVPEKQLSDRFNWTYGQWAEHVGGRHKDDNPLNYYEFGSFMAVAKMLDLYGEVQQKRGWNACRDAMLAAPQPEQSATVSEECPSPECETCPERSPCSSEEQKHMLAAAKEQDNG